MANEETNPQSKDLPYTLDYAKSNRSACKECKETIAKVLHFSFEKFG